MIQSSEPKNARRVCVYFGESDRWRGRPLSVALMETIRDYGGAGATLTRGVAGFGAASRIHTASILRLSEDLPLVLEIVDSPEKITQLLEVIYPMVSEGMITVEDLQVIRYTHRYLNPLPADKLVAEVMTRDVLSLAPDMPVSAGWQLMLEKGIKALPVVDTEGVVIGILTDEDLLERAGLQQRLAVAARMAPDLIQAELQSLKTNQILVGAVMSTPVITANEQDPLGLAAGRMVKHTLKRLPVVNANNQLVGMLSRLDILRLIAKTPPEKIPGTPTLAAGRTVQDVMRTDVPAVQQDDDLTTIVDAFLKSDSQKLVVIDEQGKPIGLISDSDVVSRLQPEHQRGVLQALRNRGRPPTMKVKAYDLMSPGVVTAAPDLPVVEAARKMLSEGRKWIVVVNADGQLTGLVDREILLNSMTAFYEGSQAD